MKAKVLGVKRRNSKYGGECMLMIFQGFDDNKKYTTWIVPEFRNFKNWQKVLESGKGTILDGLKIKTGNIIDSDSCFTVVSVANEGISVIQSSLF